MRRVLSEREDNRSRSRFLDEDNESQDLLNIIKVRLRIDAPFPHRYFYGPTTSLTHPPPPPRLKRANSSGLKRQPSMTMSMRQGSLRAEQAEAESSLASSAGVGSKRPGAFSSIFQDSQNDAKKGRKGSFKAAVQRSNSVQSSNNPRTVSNNRFVFQGMGDEVSSSNTSALWSEHVKRQTAGASEPQTGGSAALPQPPLDRKKSAPTSLSGALWAGIAANRFKRSRSARN